MLAKMGAMLELETRPARSEILLELKELYLAREALVKDRTAAKNRAKALTLALLKRHNAQRLEKIERQIETVEAALAGLAPIARQSGHWTGRAFIRGGRANVRQALYVPALVAMRFNPDLKAKYQQLVEAGKPATLALTAIMRKMIVLANALLSANRNWQPKPA
jgi:transposase